MSKRNKHNESFRGRNQDSDVLTDDSDSSTENLYQTGQNNATANQTISNANKKLRHQHSFGWVIMEGYKTLPDTKREEIKKPNKLEGYLRKRRKWPMNGWHKRYFVLERGLLYYAKTSSHISKGRYRGQIDLGLSVVSYKEKHCRIDIDADSIVHHIQIKDPKMFTEWIQSLTQHRLYRQWELTCGGGTLFPGLPEPAVTSMNELNNRSGHPSFETDDMRAFGLQKPYSAKLDLVQSDLKVLQTKLFDLGHVLDKIKIDASTPKSPASIKRCSNQLTRPTSLHQSTSNPNIHLDPGTQPKNGSQPTPNSLDDILKISPATKSALSKSFLEPAKEVLDQMRSISSILHSESERIRQEVEKLNHSGHNKAALSDRPMKKPFGIKGLQKILPRSTSSNRKFMSQSMSRDSITIFHDAAEYLESDGTSTDNSDDYTDDSEGEDQSVDEDSNIKDDLVPVITAKTGRRERLPAQQPDTTNFSLMNLLCKNIGRDLSKVRLPVILNEPLGVLQKLCEELEYSELLDSASNNKNPLERMVYVAAFAVSCYASTYFRGKTKPFNPLMCETYEYIREDKGWKFIAEQVSHHPPQAACHCQSNNWIFWQDLQLKNKFWGKSIEAIPIGSVHLSLPNCNDHYTWQKVTTCVHNIFGTDRYVDHYGDMVIEGKEAKCTLTFHKASSWSNRRYEVSGTVETKKGDSVQVFGKWNEGFYYGQQNTARCVWRSAAMPQDYELYFGFTRFAMELNELDPSLKEFLPCTDTRLRPDQRQLEDGNVDEAESEKFRLEQSQRERLKVQDMIPVWFKINESTGHYEFNNQYWKVRAEPNGFKKMNLPELW